MKYFIGYSCINCGKEFEKQSTQYTCNKCQNNVQAVYDYDLIKKQWNKESLKNDLNGTIWRYNRLYPVSGSFYSPKVGCTPLYSFDLLAQKYGLKKLYIKDDGRNPSLSFKDRASAIIVQKAIESKTKVITGASTGNAASSMACLSSCNNIKNIIFVPSTIPIAKKTQLLIFGASVIEVNGTYDNAFDLCLEATQKFGLYNRNTGYNPLTREGKKSCSFEICEELNWVVPDYVFVSVGDGNILSGLWKGFTDLYKIGFIDKLPRMASCQAKSSNAINKSIETNTTIKPVSGETIADSISVSIPRDGLAAVQAIKESHGITITLSDNEILNAIKPLATETGVFAEPAGATAYAGLIKALESRIIDSNSTVLCINTGNGLKDINSAISVAGSSLLIENNVNELDKLTNLEIFKG